MGEEGSGFKGLQVTALGLLEALGVRAQIPRVLHQSEGEQLVFGACLESSLAGGNRVFGGRGFWV